MRVEARSLVVGHPGEGFFAIVCLFRRWRENRGAQGAKTQKTKNQQKIFRMKKE
jgi:hypothetical protein